MLHPIFNTDTFIIGGGLHGCSIALHLAQKGMAVTVAEKNLIGRGASGVNAGGVRKLNRHLAEIPLCIESDSLWKNIENLVDNNCGYDTSGQIIVAENEDELGILEKRVNTIREMGYEHEVLVTKKELQRLVPSISSHCLGALVCYDDGFANPYQTTFAFYRKALSYGATIMQGCAVTHIHRVNNYWEVHTNKGTYRATNLVNCAGAWGDTIATELGDNVAFFAEAPMMMVTERVSKFVKPVIGAAGYRLSFKQQPNGSLLIGGGNRGLANREKNTTHLNFSRLAASAKTVSTLFPFLESISIVRCWAGIEGQLVDRIPVIGASAHSPNAYHAFGFSSHGFQLAPIVGQLMSELIITGEPSIPLDAFRVSRFN